MPPATTAPRFPPSSPANAEATPETSKKRPRVAGNWRPTKATVAGRLDTLGQRATTATAQQLIKKLCRQVQAGAGTAKRAARLDASLSALIGEAAEASDRLLLLEAATWVVAWRLKAKHPGCGEEQAAHLREQAHTSHGSLSTGDTSAAAFVLTVSRLLETPQRGEESAGGEPLAWTACEAEIERLVSRSGCVALDGSAAMLARVARWTHLRETATATTKASRRAKQAFSREAERRWQHATSAMLRLLGPGGIPVTASDAPLPATYGTDIVAAALTHGGKRTRATARLLLQPRGSKHETRGLSPHLDDRDAAITVFRSGWQGTPLRALLDYRREQPHLEITAGKRLLISGPWQWEVRLGGTSLTAEGPWQVTHEEEIDDASIIVIAAPLTRGLRLERHLLLAPADRVMLLADAIVETAADEHAADLTYRCSLPVPRGIDVTGGEETRELSLSGVKPQAMLMPLALNEWTAGQAAGECQWDSDSRQVQLSQRSPVRRLFAPLWLDLDPRRFGTQITWRQLTVADTRVILRPEQAAGFRIQSGLTNWLLYRALDEPRNRTVLGCNISSFFRLGQLGTDGLVSQMAEW